MNRPYDFDALRSANLERCAAWHPGGVEHWDLSEWGVALAGEVGELCEEILARRQGLESGERVSSDYSDRIGAELADVVLYLDLFVARCGFAAFSGVDLRRALALSAAFRVSPDTLGLGVSASVGKMLDIVKKLNRSRDGVTGNSLADDVMRAELGDHASQAMCRLMLLGEDWCGGFEAVVHRKFNAVSRRNGFEIFLPERDDPGDIDPASGRERASTAAGARP
jgi:NTP pyrophosphatase (non-canonical NTP hydrolase)